MPVRERHKRLGMAPFSRLERLGLIAPLPADDRRRPYELTQAGATVLRTELDALARLSTAGLQRLAGDQSGVQPLAA